MTQRKRLSMTQDKRAENLLQKHFEANMLDGESVYDCGGAMLSAKSVFEYLIDFMPDLIALYAPKSDETVESILGNFAQDVELYGAHPEQFGSAPSVSDTVAALEAHYKAKYEECERLARIDELENLPVGVDDMCADEWRERLASLQPQSQKEEK